MDADEYTERILYNGEEAAPDGETYVPFVYYFLPGEDPWGNPLPYSWNLAQEAAAATQLMSGDPGQNGVPGVDSIALALAFRG